jgi:uncharacterized protein YndB with AHSA1/START domain
MSETKFVAEPGKQQVLITHVFDAPRDRVFRMYLDPKLIPKWWGPKTLTTTVDRMDAKPGGVWRFVQRDRNGKEYSFHGVYHEILLPERVVSTSEYEGMPGHVMFETINFKERDGKTEVTESAIFQSVEDRDVMIKYNMEAGIVESMDRFEELLKKASKQGVASTL